MSVATDTDAIAVVEDGRLAWSRGFGVANAERGTPVGDKTLWEAASLSKPVFAYAVLQLVEAFAEAAGRDIPYQIVARRTGDVAEVYADPSLANDVLGWRAELGVDAICRDAWRWQSQNPQGYPAG